MGLATEESDLDFFCDIDNKYYHSARDYHESVATMKQLEEALNEDRNWNVLKINMPVPSLKAYFIPMNIKC